MKILTLRPLILRALIVPLGTLAFAADTDPRPIPAELAANYFYAQTQYIQAKRDLDEAASALQSFCTEKAVVASSPRDPRRLICNPKTEPPPAAK
jgi:hypothetical protein